MASYRSSNTIGLLLALAPVVLAQTTTSNTDQTTSTSSTATSQTSAATTGTTSTPTTRRHNSFYPSASSFYPSSTASSNSSSSGDGNGNLNSSGMIQYYFVFLALLLICLGLAIFFMFRKRSRLRAARRGGQTAGGPNVSGGWYGAPPRETATGRRRNRRGRWEDADAEEGLNEHGEAPPPYLPKRQSQELQRNGDGAPAIPMETLSRDDAGLKPPDYTDTRTYQFQTNVANSGVGAGSTQTPERPTNS